MKEERRIDSSKVREYCIAKGFYTKGSCKQYDNLLNDLCDWEKQISMEMLEEIAIDILDHSKLDEEIKIYGCTIEELKRNTMHELVKQCCYSFFK